MESKELSKVPALDRDIARRIVAYLSQQDVVSIGQTCRSFWDISCGASRLRCSLAIAPEPAEAQSSFTSFVRKRCNNGMEVEELQLTWCDHSGFDMPQSSVLQWCKQLQPQLAPSLKKLVLGNLHHTEMTSRSILLAALSECSRLRHLVLWQYLDEKEKLAWERPSLEARKFDLPMVEALSEKLPDLAVVELQLEGYMSLQAAQSGMARVPSGWQPAGLPSLERRGRLHFTQELIRSIVQSEAAGMQLLQIGCGIGQDQIDCTHLPPTLRYLSSPCSFAANECAYQAASSSLEEAVLFLGIAEFVLVADMRLSSITWTILSKVLLPSAQTLKAVMLLMASARGFFSVQAPSQAAHDNHYGCLAQDISLPQLSFLGAPLGLWLYICSRASDQALSLAKLTTLFLNNNERFVEAMWWENVKKAMTFTSQLTALQSLRLTVPPEWAMFPEGQQKAWAMVFSVPNLLSLVLVVPLEDSATADRELVDFLAAAPRSMDGRGSGSRLEHLGILAVEPVLDTEEELLPPGPDLVLWCGVPLAHEQGAEGVCTAIGGLVQNGVLPALKEVVICPVRHVREDLNGVDGFYSGPVEGPFQARHVKCRALSPARDVLMAYETSVYCSDTDSSEERARMARMVSQMHI